MGTVGVIHQLARVPDGSVRLMVQGLERVRLLDLVSTEPYLVARVEAAPEPSVQATEVDALRRALVDIFRRLVEASPELPDELAGAVENVTDPRHLAYFVASVLPLDVAVRQELLEMDTDPGQAPPAWSTCCSASWPCASWAGRSRPTPRSGSPRSSASSTCASSSGRSSGSSGRRTAADSQVAELRRRIEEAGLPEEARREAERELRRLVEHPAGLARARHDRHLSRVDGEPALEQAGRRGHRHPPGPRGPGRGPLRPGEGQGSDPRVPGGQEAPPGAGRAGGPVERWRRHPRPPSRRA